MSRAHPMSKPTITRLSVGAIVAVAGGLVLVWAAVASDLVVTVTLVVVGSPEGWDWPARAGLGLG
jgi:hypothetical protein